MHIKTLESFFEKHQIILLVAASVSAVAFFSVPEIRYQYSLADEGFFWYGVKRTLAGEIAVRDFMSYDVGRYYIAALLLKLFGDSSIVALRYSFAAVGVFTVFLSLRLIFMENKAGFIKMLLSSMLLSVWMIPFHKIYDMAASVVVVAVLVYMAESQNRKRFLYGGAALGIITVIGRNHGLYGVLAGLLFLVYDFSGTLDLLKKVRDITIGFALGFMPNIFLFLFVHDYFSVYAQSLIFHFENKATNIALPFPWLWKTDMIQSSGGFIKWFVKSAAFTSLVFTGAAGSLYAIFQSIKKRKISAVAAASFFTCLAYAHFASSRADVSHIAQSIFPLMIFLLYAVNRQSNLLALPLILMLLASSFYLLLDEYPVISGVGKENYKPIYIGGSKMYVGDQIRVDLELIERINKEYNPEKKSFFVTPVWPGAYPVFDAVSPVWETYALFFRSESFEKAEIERFKKADVGVVIIANRDVAGKSELRFINTHPLLYGYIKSNYKLVEGGETEDYIVFDKQ